MTDLILDALDPEQRRVATLLDRLLVALAGMRTGRTRAITHQVTHAVQGGRYVPATTLAVTFTTWAAGESKLRLVEPGVHKVSARTIHATALSQCRYFWPTTYGSEFPELLDDPLPLMGWAANRVLGNADANLVRDLIGETGWAKSNDVSPGHHARLVHGREVAGVESEHVARVMEIHEKYKTSTEMVDFNDILLCAAASLVEHPAVAEQIRDAYRHFVMDEYQGVFAIQHRLVSLRVDGCPDICAVGNPQQAIHGLTGARADCLTGFASEHPRAHQVRLVHDYRFGPGIVQLANCIVRRHPGTGDLHPARPEGPPPEPHVDGTEEDGTRTVIVWLGERYVEGTPRGECAVLRRINVQSPVFESAPDTARIPYQAKGTDRFWERSEMRDVVNRLHRAVQRDPEAHPKELLDEILAEL